MKKLIFLLAIFCIFIPNLTFSKECRCKATVTGASPPEKQGSNVWTDCQVTQEMKRLPEDSTLKDYFNSFINQKNIINVNFCFPYSESKRYKYNPRNRPIKKPFGTRNACKSHSSFEALVKKNYTPSAATKGIYPRSYTGFYIFSLKCRRKKVNKKGSEKQKETNSAISFSIPSGSELNKISATSFPKLVGQTIKIVLQVIGTGALLMFIYGGLQIMTSRGQSDKYNQGMKTMLWSAIGVITVLSSYALVSFVFQAF